MREFYQSDAFQGWVARIVASIGSPREWSLTNADGLGSNPVSTVRRIYQKDDAENCWAAARVTADLLDRLREL